MSDTLEEREPHPAAHEAKIYLMGLGLEKLYRYQEAFASCSIEGNRTAEICSGTLRRMLNAETVSDRYVLGLAWTIRDMEDDTPK